MVIDPWGAIIAQCPDRPGLALATIDHEYQKQVRASVPSLLHRRLR
jgi:nitrilase